MCTVLHRSYTLRRENCNCHELKEYLRSSQPWYDNEVPKHAKKSCFAIYIFFYHEYFPCNSIFSVLAIQRCFTSSESNTIT